LVDDTGVQLDLIWLFDFFCA